MNFNGLIDAVVRQTTVLLAHLATATGVRAPLAHLANQVFLDLVSELEAQGLGRKVVADMFGIALRSYQLKVRRLSESATDRNRTLWEAALSFIQEQRVVSRIRLDERFRQDDEQLLRAVLHDLVESGLIYRTGRGRSTAFRAASAEELGDAFQTDPESMAEPYVWIVVYRNGPVTRARIAAETRLSEAVLDKLLARLVADGRIELVEGGGVPRFGCRVCLLPAGTTVGWEAALFDHFQAMVTAMCAKLRRGETRSLPSDVVGGSTWSFDIWRGHPREEEVLGLLRELRRRVSTLRGEVTAYNEQNGRPPDRTSKITFYMGQSGIFSEEYASPREND